MFRILNTTRAAAISFLVATGTAHAAPVTIDVTATMISVTGSFTDALAPGQTIIGNFVYDTNEALASSAITTPSTVPGHEFTSFYEFAGPPYGVSISIPELSESFTAGTTGVVVNNDLFIDGGDVGGLIASGNHDWIELLGSSTVDICLLPGGCLPNEFQPADGNEWTLAIFSDTGWFSDGSVIPDVLPETFTPVIVGLEFDEFGNEVGAVIASVSSFVTSSDAVPEPGTLVVFGIGVAGLIALRRRQRL